MTGENPEVLLILVPWDPPTSFLESLPTISPGIRVIAHKTNRDDTIVPAGISPEIWKTVTVLFTWRWFPAKEQAPNLRYVQLLSAGSIM
jgi:hypothetical protein